MSDLSHISAPESAVAAGNGEAAAPAAAAKKTLRLPIVDDHPLTREGVRACLPPCELDQPIVALTEREVMRLVGQGFGNRGIGVALRTLGTYRTRLMRKLDRHDTAGLRACASASLRLSAFDSLSGTHPTVN